MLVELSCNTGKRLRAQWPCSCTQQALLQIAGRPLPTHALHVSCVLFSLGEVGSASTQKPCCSPPQRLTFLFEQPVAVAGVTAQPSFVGRSKQQQQSGAELHCTNHYLPSSPELCIATFPMQQRGAAPSAAYEACDTPDNIAWRHSKVQQQLASK